MIQVKIIEDITQEPVSLKDAKEWLQIDYSDWDSLINMLITASRQQSEKVSGLAYGDKIIEVTGNESKQKVYPIQPFIEDEEWVDEDGVIKYRYKAGIHPFPMDLKVAVLQRIATGFAYRQNGIGEAVNMAVNQSHHAELKYSYLYV
jgi:hypothetical protein